MKTIVCLLITLFCYNECLYSQEVKNIDYEQWMDFTLELAYENGKPSEFIARLTNKTPNDLILILDKYCLSSEVELVDKNVIHFDNQLVLDAYVRQISPVPILIGIKPEVTYSFEIPLVIGSYGVIDNKGVLPASESFLRKSKRARICLKNVEGSIIMDDSVTFGEKKDVYSNWVDIKNVSNY